VRIIRITDEPIERWSDALCLPTGETGEIAVKGPMVTREYVADIAATARAKILDAADDGPPSPTASAGGAAPAGAATSEVPQVWHRMGDVGYLDAQGRVWFCGRKAHRVVTADGTLFTVPCEAIFNNHPAVFRSALVGVGAAPNQTPVLCVELEEDYRRAHGSALPASLTDALLALGRKHESARRIRHILSHPAFPVDIRHNSKIFREKLALWAAGRIGEALKSEERKAK
jgi:acyl-CoA synthetase (AMP-forming)/AMP-acid ligase II